MPQKCSIAKSKKPHVWIVVNAATGDYVYTIHEGLFHVPRYPSEEVCSRANKWTKAKHAAHRYEVKRVRRRDVRAYEHEMNRLRDTKRRACTLSKTNEIAVAAAVFLNGRTRRRMR